MSLLRLPLLLVFCLLPAGGLTFGAARAAEETRPNIILLLADDMGYGDIGVHGCRDIATPHIDSIAQQGVRFTQGYVSAPQCAPSRCGLLTGRYQQRFGYESNSDGPDEGLPLEEKTVADRLRAAGYATGMVGKWHLGQNEAHHPNRRGFTEFFGFLGGANPYLPRGPQGIVPRILRNSDAVPEKEYLTDAFGREAAAFVDRHRSHPFFLYVAFNAPHTPLEATEQYLARFPEIEDETRRTYAAMVSAMDDAIGRTLQQVRAHGLERNTIILFLSDNGGPLGRAWNGSSNQPLRGQKGDCLEGGIRVPFLMKWPTRLPAGKRNEHPVISLDIAPALLRAAGASMTAGALPDGVDLLHTAGRDANDPPGRSLFWRFNFPRAQPAQFKWAVRQGDQKLVREAIRAGDGRFTGEARTGLYDLSRDAGEASDLSGAEPETAARLQDAWRRWEAEMPPVRFNGSRNRARPAGRAPAQGSR